jgi:hypothetical protein
VAFPGRSARETGVAVSHADNASGRPGEDPAQEEAHEPLPETTDEDGMPVDNPSGG